MNDPLLVRHFTEKFARRMDKRIESIPAATMRKLTQWPWPGNVRELENLARRLAALYPQETITAAVIDAELVQPAIVAAGAFCTKRSPGCECWKA